MIPKIIHQVFTNSFYHQGILYNQRRLQDLNPDWHYRLYDEEAIWCFLESSCTYEIIDAYYDIKPQYEVTRIDFLKHLLMYHYGGVYLDIKSTCTRPLNSFIKKDDVAIVSQWNNRGETDYPDLRHCPGGEYLTWFMIYERESPISKAMIDECLIRIQFAKKVKEFGRVGSFRVTGPIMYTQTLLKSFPHFKHRIIRYEDVGLRYSFLGDGLSLDHMTWWQQPHYSLCTESVVD